MKSAPDGYFEEFNIIKPYNVYRNTNYAWNSAVFLLPRSVFISRIFGVYITYTRRKKNKAPHPECNKQYNFHSTVTGYEVK